MNFNGSSGKPENLHLMGYFCRKYVMLEPKKIEAVCREKWLMVSNMT